MRCKGISRTWKKNEFNLTCPCANRIRSARLIERRQKGVLSSLEAPKMCPHVTRFLIMLRLKKKKRTALTEKKLMPGDTDVPRVNEDYIIQVLEEIDGRLPKNCLRSLAGQRVGFWALCRNWTISFWTHKFRCNPEPFRRLPGITKGKTRSTVKTVAGMIFILEWVLWSTRPRNPWI